MRQPRPSAFNPSYQEKSLEEIDMVGVVPIKPKPAHTVYEKQGNKETRKLAEKQGNKEACLEPDPPIRLNYYRKQTFEFADNELDFLDEAKLEVRRNFGFRVTKNEIMRTALEFLEKDFHENKETSFLVRKFTGKQGNK